MLFAMILPSFEPASYSAIISVFSCGLEPVEDAS